MVSDTMNVGGILGLPALEDLATLKCCYYLHYITTQIFSLVPRFGFQFQLQLDLVMKKQSDLKEIDPESLENFQGLSGWHI